MSLTVKVVRYKDHPPENMLSACFGPEGGILGRNPENHFVLDDPEEFVSGEHAFVSYENGCYYITDISKNGTCICNKNLELRGQKAQLHNGDRLRICEYDLVVSIVSEKIASNLEPPPDIPPKKLDIEDIFGESQKKKEYQSKRVGDEDNNFPQKGVSNLEPPPDIPPKKHTINDFFPESQENKEYQSKRAGDEDNNFPQKGVSNLEPPPDIPPKKLDIEDIFGESQQEPVYPPKKNGDEDNNFPQKGVSNLGPPPDIPPKKLDIEDIFGEGQEKLVYPPKGNGLAAVQIPPPTKPNEAYDELLHVFLKGAAIEDKSLFEGKDIPELMQTVGSVFRELINGLMTILQARSELKGVFRVPGTVLRGDKNNPLKFSPTVDETLKVDEALKQLLIKTHPGFTDAVDAVREGFRDVQHHQIAIIAGVKAFLVNVLKKFEPEKFEKQCQGGISLHKKAKCWDAYNQSYLKITEEAMENLFGEEFARAYENQILKLRAKNKNH